jgi:DnaJ-class molecular chaperone
MAGDGSDSEDQAEGSHGPRECMPCRGSGQLISHLGGTPSKVTCPWCGGGGVRVPGTDAQAGWPAADGEAAVVDPAPEPAA